MSGMLAYVLRRLILGTIVIVCLSVMVFLSLHLAPGDPIEVVLRPGHGLTVPMFFRASMGDKDLADVFLAARVLPQAEHEWLASRG